MKATHKTDEWTNAYLVHRHTRPTFDALLDFLADRQIQIFRHVLVVGFAVELCLEDRSSNRLDLRRVKTIVGGGGGEKV